MMQASLSSDHLRGYDTYYTRKRRTALDAAPRTENRLHVFCLDAHTRSQCPAGLDMRMLF